MNAAEQARSKAIARLKATPRVDTALAEERAAKAREREVAQADRRARARAEREATRAAQTTAPEGSDVTVGASAPPGPTETERKAARDVRYAARKARRK